MTTLLMILIYVSGVLISYGFGRYLFRKGNPYYVWSDVIMVLFLSVFSWFTVIMLVVVIISEKEPPNWL